MKRKLLFHLICILLCCSIVLNNSCLIYANSTGGISNPDDYQTYPNGMRKYSLNEALSEGLAETAKTVVFLASGLFAVADGDGNAAMENLVNWMQVAGWGDEKMFVVDDNGKMSTLPAFKQMVTEYKNYYIQNNPDNVTYLPYTITSYSDDKEFQSFYSTSNSLLFGTYKSMGGVNGVLESNSLSDYELVVMTPQYDFEAFTFNVYKKLYHGKNVYNFFAYMPPNECNEAGNFYCRNNVLNNLYYYDVGRGICNNYESLGTEFFYHGRLNNQGVLNKSYDCRNVLMHKYNDFVYNGFNMITPDGASFMAFTSVDNAKAYFNSLSSAASSSGITINNYNHIYKYLSNPEEPGSVVVSPNNVVDFEPKNYTFDRPTGPGDSDDDEGNRHGGGSGSSATLGTVVSAINKLYDMVEQKLDKIISQIRTNNILTGLDLLNDIFNDYIKDFATATTELGTTVKSKFPFCLPFVIVGALALTNKSATVPKFTIPFKYDTIGVNYDIVIDFSDAKWSACRNVIYYFTLFFYMFGLIYLTFKASKVKE